MTKKPKFAGNTAGRILRGAAIVMLVASAPLFSTPIAWAGGTGYIRLIGPHGAIEGASKDSAHRNWIEIKSAESGGLEREARADRDASSGMGSGKRTHEPFTIVKELDAASPELTRACASGQHFAEVDVDLGTGAKYKLTDAIIVSMRKAGGDPRAETVSFSYQKIEVTY